MKKQIPFLLLVALAPTAFAADCKPAAQYNVEPTNIARTGIDQALKQLTAKTPLRLKIAPNSAAAEVGADGIAGPLNEVLDELVGSTGNAWSQSGCQIVVYRDKEAQRAEAVALAPSPMNAGWRVNAGDSLHEVMRRWAEPGGWQVIWSIDETETLRLMANASFQGTLEEAVEDLAEALAGSGEVLRFVFHRGNKVLRISRVN